MHIRILIAVLAASSGSVFAQGGFNFTPVTLVARGMINGTNVQTPVRGFELLLMRDGEVLYHRTFGAYTLNRIAACDSATKGLSAGVMTAVMDNSPTPLSLDSTLGTFFSGLSADKSGITIRQSFCHVAGLSESTSGVGSSTLTLQEAAALILSRPLQHPAGTAFSYGGAEMHVGGAVAELAAGQPWNSVFSQRIAQPLGWTQTQFVLSSPSNPRIAGGAESNAIEFSRYMEMLRRGGVWNNQRVLSREGVDAIFTRQTPLNVPVISSPILSGNADYGFGMWLDQRDANGELVGAITAGARGFASWIDFDDRIVGVFATDLTSSSNTQPALYLLRDAAQAAVRAGPACDEIDFNLDGFFPDDRDLVDFLSVLSGGPCSTDPSLPGNEGLDGCNDIDFNNDGLFPDDADLLSYLQVLSGGAC